jgi:hypothetical protein
MAMTRVRRYWRPSEGFGIWEDITAWCFEQFGLPGERQEEWNYVSDAGWMDFYFRDPKSAEFFILKWM